MDAPTHDTLVFDVRCDIDASYFIGEKRNRISTHPKQSCIKRLILSGSERQTMRNHDVCYKCASIS